MLVEVEVEVPQEETNFDVVLPKDPVRWARRLQEGIADVGHICIAVDNLAHGCGAVSISFLPAIRLKHDPEGNTWGWLDEGKAFGFTVSREKLAEIIRALSYAYDNFDRDIYPTTTPQLDDDEA